MNTPNSIKFFDHTDISLDDVIAISEWIAEENKKKPHMIQEKPHTILECVQKYGWMVAKTLEWQLAGFIKLSELDADTQIFERGSLFVMPTYRNHWIGKTLIETITEQYGHLSMLSVTNVPSVIKINSSHSKQIELLGSKIPKKLKDIIEWPQALLPDDKVFANLSLYNQVISGKFD